MEGNPQSTDKAALHNLMPTGPGLTHLLTSVAYMGGDIAVVGLLKHAYKIQPGQPYDFSNKLATKEGEMYEKKLELKSSERLV